MKKTYKRWIHQEQNNGVKGQYKEVIIEQKTIGRGHKYVVSNFNEDYEGVQMPSVTGITGATDGSGTSPIARWSVKHALAHIEDALAGEDPITIHEIELEKDLADAKAEPDRMLKKAGARGTRIHNAVEAYLTNGDWKGHLTDEDSTESLKVCFEKIESWIAEMGFKIKGTELPVFHTDLAVGGAIDMVVSDESNTIYVCDFKTGSNIYFKDALQVSAYISCVASMIGNHIDIWDGYKDQMHHRVDELQLGGAVIHIDEENEKVSINHLPEQLIGGQAFLHATLLYEAQKYSKYHSVKL